MLDIIRSVIMSIFNFTQFKDNFNDFWTYPYTTYLGANWWAVIFIGVFGMSFTLSKGNLAVTTAAILITFGAFGTTEVFLGNPEFSMFFSIIAIAGYAATVVLLFVKRGWAD